jgi:hypothetical protein
MDIAASDDVHLRRNKTPIDTEELKSDLCTLARLLSSGDMLNSFGELIIGKLMQAVAVIDELEHRISCAERSLKGEVW